MTFLGHTKCRNDVIHQCCGLQDFKIVENYNILPGKICNTPKIFFQVSNFENHYKKYLYILDFWSTAKLTLKADVSLQWLRYHKNNTPKTISFMFFGICATEVNVSLLMELSTFSMLRTFLGTNVKFFPGKILFLFVYLQFQRQ